MAPRTYNKYKHKSAYSARITENQAYEYIVSATDRLRSNGLGEPFDSHPKVKELDLNFERCTTSGFGLTGQDEYSGLIVTDGPNQYRVFDIFIDLSSDEDTSIEDVTNQIVEDNPEHKKCDIRKPIPMAILYFLEQFGELPKRYEKDS